MPELPEVQTTVNGLNKTVKGRMIVSVETTYKSLYHKGSDNIKDPSFFKKFRDLVVGQKILKAERRAKNVLMHLSGGYTILVHMKMTGHFVYDRPGYPFTRLNFKLDNTKTLVLSDMRKFAKVTFAKTADISKSIHLEGLGPEPLEDKFDYKTFKSQLLKRGTGKIKTVLMDQTLLAGVGNIYSDEILWRAGVHPLSIPKAIPEKQFKLMFIAMKEVLQKGIDFGGDSMSDYRNIEGERGKFQEYHRAYRRHKTRCSKKNCPGTLERVVVGARSAHFCPVHQKLYAKK